MSGMPGLKRQSRPSSLLQILGTLWLVVGIGLMLFHIATPASILIEWDTATEMDTAGFYVYRANQPTDEFQRVNQAMIPSVGNATSGGSYSYADEDVAPGETYYYLLEEVENDSSTNRYEDEMFSYTVPQNWGLTVISVISVLVGLAMLLIGVKPKRSDEQTNFYTENRA